MYGIRRNHTYLGAIYRIINKYSPRVLLTLSTALAGYIAWIIYTSPEPYIDDREPQACIPSDLYQEDDNYFNYASMPSEGLFEEGKEYGKDGEEIIPGSVEPFLGIIPDLGIDMYALPYYPPVIAHTPSTTSTPEAPRTIKPIPNLVPFGWWYREESNNSTPKPKTTICANPTEVDEPNITYLTLLGLCVLIYIRNMK